MRKAEAMSKADDIKKGSVWCVARVKVLVKSGTEPADIVSKVKSAIVCGMDEWFHGDHMGSGVVVIEDPSKVLAYEPQPRVPVVIGAVTVCPGKPKVGECLGGRLLGDHVDADRVVGELIGMDKYRFSDHALVADVAREVIKEYSGR